MDDLSRPADADADVTRWIYPACVTALTFVVFCWVGVKSSLVGINSDAAVYLLLADHFSPWYGLPPDLAEHLFSRYPFPPAYPLLLGWLGGGSAVPSASFMINAGLLALGLGLATAWMRTAGVPALVAVAASLITAMTPAILQLAMGIYSESAFLVWLFAGLLVYERSKQSAATWYLSALILSIAAVTRTAGVIAVGALILCWAWHTRMRQFRYLPFLALAATLGWQIVRQANGAQIDYLHDLAGDSFIQSLQGYWEQGVINLGAMGYHWIRCFDVLGSDYSHFALVLSGSLTGLGLMLRLRRLDIDALFVAGYLLLLVVWPYPNQMQRFFAILLPFAMYYLYFGIAAARMRLTSSLLTGLALSAAYTIVLIVSLPSTAYVAQQLAVEAGTPSALNVRMPGWYRENGRDRAMMATSQEISTMHGLSVIGSYIPKTACVTSTKAEKVMLYMRRRALRAPLEDMDALRAVVAECPWVVMTRSKTFPSRYESFYPLAELRDELEWVAAMPQARAGAKGQVEVLLARFRSKG